MNNLSFHSTPHPIALLQSDSVVVVFQDANGIPKPASMRIDAAGYYLGLLQNGNFAAANDAQRRPVLLRRTTPDATPLSLLTDGATAALKVIIANSTSSGFVATITARDSTGNTARFKIEGAIKRGANAASTAIVGSVTVTTLAADAALSTCSVTAVADTTNGGLDIQVTGVAATSIRWFACVLLDEVSY